MIRGIAEEARLIVKEMPAFAAAFLVLTALCIGVRCTVFDEADGERLRLFARCGVSSADDGRSWIDPIHRMRSRGSHLRVPGFTVILGLRQYNMELTVPAATMQALLENKPVHVRRFPAFEMRGTA